MTGRAKFWGKFQYVSNKQIDLAFAMYEYRRRFNMSQNELARICNLYGAMKKIKFTGSQIGTYERMETAPRADKYLVLCNVLHINA